MSNGAARKYLFETAEQWGVCLFAGADRGSKKAPRRVRPIAPYALPGALITSAGAHAPAITPTGEIVWIDEAGRLLRRTACDEAPARDCAPGGIRNAKRLISSAAGIWTYGGPAGSIELYEDDTLTRLLSVRIPQGRVWDVAAGKPGGIFALVERKGAWTSVPVDTAGRTDEPVTFANVSGVTAFTWLRGTGTFVLLDGRRLRGFSAQGGMPLWNVEVGGLHPCFKATVLGSDARERVFVGGVDGPDAGGAAFVLLLDADGRVVGEIPMEPVDAEATGVTASRSTLAVTTRRGLLRFTETDTVPSHGRETTGTLITPVLRSPDREDARRWLRIEATTSLPPGTTLELSFAAAVHEDGETAQEWERKEEENRERLVRIFDDTSLNPGERIRKLSAMSEVWRKATAFHGSDALATTSGAPLSAPLFDVSQPYIWVRATLTAAPGARLPELSRLAVLYPGRSLMEDLPAIYRRDESASGSFIRALVGVLEATTQDLDARIGAMGSRINPSTASGPWLDFVARWVGVPWDDGLADAQKVAILKSAPELANQRGTRAGLETLLEALMPGMPRRYRVVDPAADFGFATVGGGCCPGSSLPALLGGATRWRAELDGYTVLGRTMLPCPDQRDDGASHLGGRLRIDIGATAEERAALEPWLAHLIEEMVPVTLRPSIRWVSKLAFGTHELDGNWKLEAPPQAHLGTDAITGVARLPEGRPRLSASGLEPGARLR